MKQRLRTHESMSTDKEKPAYRTSARIAALATTAVLVVNVTVFAWAVSKPIDESSSVTDRLSPFRKIWQGDCATAGRVNTGLHIVINILSTILLSCSNYCMQCLSAPSRDELDRAHAKYKCLNIGVPSMRNLRYISRTKLGLWCLLLVSSLPLHLLYNSVVFESLYGNDYDVLNVSHEFVGGKPFNSTDLFDYRVSYTIQRGLMYRYHQIQQDAKTYQRLSNRECIKAFARDLVPDREAVLLISFNSSDPRLVYQTNKYESANGHIYGSGGTDISFVWAGQPYDWICDSRPLRAASQHDCLINIDKAIEYADEWAPFGLPVEYCLSKKVPERCGIHFNYHIMIAVISCNLVKVICMLVVSCRTMPLPLLTMGDAVASFMTRADLQTDKMCLRHYWTLHHWSPVLQRKYHATMYCQKKAVSRSRLVFTTTMIIASLLVIGILLFMSIQSSHQAGYDTFKQSLDLGFGEQSNHLSGTTIDAQYINFTLSFVQQLNIAVVIANSPQTILSGIYFVYNSVLTSMALAQEWSSFAIEKGGRKSLRVSQPRGTQRKTYFLQLPYRLALPFIALSTLLHWMVSQSLFLVVVMIGGIDDPGTVGCGFSITALFTLICMITAALIVTGLWCSKKLQSAMPIAGANSAAIAAACHPPPGEKFDPDAAEQPLAWGVCPGFDATEDEPGHCGFSNKVWKQPTEGLVYE